MPESSSDGQKWTVIGVLDKSLNYAGPWHNLTIPKTNNAIKGVSESGNVTMKFSGTSVKVVGFLNTSMLSTSRYYIDNQFQSQAAVTVHTSPGVSQTLFMSSQLKGGNHVLLVEHNASDGGTLWLDQFEFVAFPQMADDMAASQSDQQPEQSSPSSSPQGIGLAPINSVPKMSVMSKSSSSIGPQSTSLPANGGSTGRAVNGGEIAGIIIACLVIIGAIAGYVLFRRRKRTRRRRHLADADDASTTTIVRIVSRADDDISIAESQTLTPSRRDVSWVIDGSHAMPTVTNTSSVVLTSAFAPTGVMSSVGDGSSLLDRRALAPHISESTVQRSCSTPNRSTTHGPRLRGTRRRTMDMVEGTLRCWPAQQEQYGFGYRLDISSTLWTTLRSFRQSPRSLHFCSIFPENIRPVDLRSLGFCRVRVNDMHGATIHPYRRQVRIMIGSLLQWDSSSAVPLCLSVRLPVIPPESIKIHSLVSMPTLLSSSNS
ncbi:hypothetical protein NM688_g1568 [Phlebia brevispora]|uniref:Uncharacterized protein n=1 Tax=Phlebia brevispora TaxID=194682 RepID=A0ACC1TBD0_9APHY|nr:hypothetical protein NM688_g1568 [Phlebia brevispora]